MALTKPLGEPPTVSCDPPVGSVPEPHATWDMQGECHEERAGQPGEDLTGRDGASENIPLLVDQVQLFTAALQ